MLTCCPQCETCFRITEDQLALAKGLVRCGHCQKVFNGRENITTAATKNSTDKPLANRPHKSDINDKKTISDKVAPTTQTGDEPLSSPSAHFELPLSYTQDELNSPTHEIPNSRHSSSSSEDSDKILNELADDWFLQDRDDRTAEPEQTLAQEKTEETYEYADISDGLAEEQGIEDIFSDMHHQLEQGIAELEKNKPDTGILFDDNDHSEKLNHKVQYQKEKTIRPSDEDEINQAIDSIFADSELPLYGEQDDEQEHRVEKEMLAAFGKNIHIDSSDNIQFEDDATSLANLAHPLEGELPSSMANIHEQDIPRRLRDSIAIAEPTKTSFWKILLGLLLTLLLSAALLAQLALFRNIEIVNQFPQTRPWLEQFCHYAPCRIHTQRDIDKISILERDIRAHPKNKKALQISATIANKAQFNQPYPDIQVSLSDLTGSVIAQRRFTPSDYLGSLNSPFLLMKQGTPVHIRIEVLDPGRNAVSFEFQFL